MMDKLFVQWELVGWISVVCSLLSFQQKKRGALMALQTTASITCAINMFILGDVVGGAQDVLAFFRSLTFSQREKKWASSPLWLVGFMAAMVVTGLLTWQSPLSVFPILGSLCSTVALWMKDVKWTRRISLLVGVCWITNHLFVGNISGIAMEAIAMLSILIGILRHDIQWKKPTDQETEPVKN
ncbi:MAG: YgjV family protein [Clostridia bacterium]|nr:YgjV family protein [Clostridia bacterium]